VLDTHPFVSNCQFAQLMEHLQKLLPDLSLENLERSLGLTSMVENIFHKVVNYAELNSYCKLVQHGL
jgi:hypothetical protein